MGTNDQIVDVAIIGGAVAGLAAALFTARRGLTTRILTKGIGGQLMTTVGVPNYPGFANTTGPELVAIMRKQAEAASTTITTAEVTSLTAPVRSGEPFTITTANGGLGSLHARTVIICLGKTPRSLHVPGERELLGKGVSHAGVADIQSYAGKTVVVVGGGSSAFEALTLAQKVAQTVHLVHHNDSYRAEETVVTSLATAPNIVWHTFSEVTAIAGSETVTGVTIKNVQTQELHKIPADAVFIEIGFEVKADLFASLVTLDARKHIVVNNRGETSQPGLFAAGDVTDSPYNQAIISAGEGARAALSAYSYLTGKPAGADWGV